MQARPLGQEDPLEEGMATHSSVLAQRIPWTEEPGGPQSMGSQSQTREVTQHACILNMRALMTEEVEEKRKVDVFWQMG